MTISKNEDTDSRSGSIMFAPSIPGLECSFGSVNVEQEARECSCRDINIPSSTYTFLADGETRTINNIYCDCGTLSFQSSVNWISCQYNASNSALTVTVTENSGDERDGRIYTNLNGTECTSKRISIIQEATTVCRKAYQRSLKVMVRADSSLTIAGTITLNDLDMATLSFGYGVGGDHPEQADLAGYQVNAIRPNGQSVWEPTDDLNGIICTDDPSLERYSFDGFPEEFHVTINGETYLCNQRTGKPNWYYATDDITFYFHLDYEVTLDNDGNVVFTIVIYEDYN